MPSSLLLLISSILIASSLACAPHKPTRKPPTATPDKPCVPLSMKMRMDNCEGANTPKKCSEPVENSETKFTCVEGAQPTVGIWTYKLLNSITCDPATGEWIFDGPDGKMTADEFARKDCGCTESTCDCSAADIEFACAK